MFNLKKTNLILLAIVTIFSGMNCRGPVIPTEEDLADYEIKPFADKRLADYRDWHGYDAQLGKHINKMLLEIEALDI